MVFNQKIFMFWRKSNISIQGVFMEHGDCFSSCMKIGEKTINVKGKVRNLCKKGKVGKFQKEGEGGTSLRKWEHFVQPLSRSIQQTSASIWFAFTWHWILFNGYVLSLTKDLPLNHQAFLWFVIPINIRWLETSLWKSVRWTATLLRRWSRFLFVSRSKATNNVTEGNN